MKLYLAIMSVMLCCCFTHNCGANEVQNDEDMEEPILGELSQGAENTKPNLGDGGKCKRSNECQSGKCFATYNGDMLLIERIREDADRLGVASYFVDFYGKCAREATKG